MQINGTDPIMDPWSFSEYWLETISTSAITLIAQYKKHMLDCNNQGLSSFFLFILHLYLKSKFQYEMD
jgi:hypothetical protein